MKRFVLMLTLVGSIAADCGLGGDDATGPDDDHSLVGTWNLQSINNDPIPSNWNDNGTIRVVTGGQIVVNANLSFTYSETVQGGNPDNVSGVCSLTTPPGTYTCDPTEQAGESTQTNGTAVVNGNSMTLTINEGGASGTTTRVYGRQ